MSAGAIVRGASVATPFVDPQDPGGKIPAGDAIGNILMWNGTAWVPVVEPTEPGDLIVWNGTSWQKLAPGSQGQSLVVLASGEVAWRDNAPFFHFATSTLTGGGGADRWAADNGSQAAQTTDTWRQLALQEGVLANLAVLQQLPGTADANITYRVQIAGADTPLTVTLSNAAGAVTTDVTHNVNVARFDQIGVKISRSASPATPAQDIVIGFQLLPKAT